MTYNASTEGELECADLATFLLHCQNPEVVESDHSAVWLCHFYAECHWMKNLKNQQVIAFSVLVTCKDKRIRIMVFRHYCHVF